MKITDKQIRAYTLKNAIAYGGKANPGAILGALFNEGLEKSKVKDIIPQIQKIIKEVEKLSLEEQRKEFESLEKNVSKRVVREGLPELPDVKKSGVVMRFSPSPSGGLHVGHAITSCLNYLYVQRYGGTYYIRIEDTNPENIYVPAYKLIGKEAKWLFKDKVKIIIQSDRMKLYYKYAEKLINKKAAYVCTCSGDDFREFVKTRKIARVEILV